MRKFLAWAIGLFLMICLPVSAFANSETNYVNDWAGLLTVDEIAHLESLAEKISETYQCGIYIIAVENFQDYLLNEGSYNVDDAAMDISDYYQMGYGKDHSNVILILSMAERDYAIVSHGYGNVAFTDYGKEQMEQVFLDDFRENNWYQGFNDYLEKCAEYLKLASEGTAVDVHTEPTHLGTRMLLSYGVCLLVGVIAAAIACQNWKRKMNTARLATEAGNYVVNQGIEFKIRTDRFAHRHRDRRKIETESKSSGGGGTTVNSRGYSSRSGKF